MAGYVVRLELVQTINTEKCDQNYIEVFDGMLL